MSRLFNTLKVIRLKIQNKGLNAKYSLFALDKLLLRRRLQIDCILCGFPRSGTHWITNVLERTTGRKAMSLDEMHNYDFSQKQISVLKVHGRSKTMALFKAWLFLPPFRFNNKFIYTYRDPRDAIISLYEMYKVLKNNESLSFIGFINLYDPIGQYKWEVSNFILSNDTSVFPVKFEDLRTNPEVKFAEMFKFLGIDNFSLTKDVIDQQVAAADRTDRPRASVSAWKQSYEKYKDGIELINDRCRYEMERLQYEITTEDKL